MAVRFPQPATPAGPADPLRIELALRLGPALRLVFFLLAGEFTLQPRAPTRRRL